MLTKPTTTSCACNFGYYAASGGACTVYLVYSYKSTNTDTPAASALHQPRAPAISATTLRVAAHAHPALPPQRHLQQQQPVLAANPVMQVLTLLALHLLTGTAVQILTPEALQQ